MMTAMMIEMTISTTVITANTVTTIGTIDGC